MPNGPWGQKCPQLRTTAAPKLGTVMLPPPPLPLTPPSSLTCSPPLRLYCSLPLSANTAPVQWYQTAQACLSQEEPRAMLGRITFLPPTQPPGSEFGRRYRTPQPSSDCHSRLCHMYVSGRGAGRGPGLGPVRSAASPGPPQTSLTSYHSGACEHIPSQQLGERSGLSNLEARL